MSYQKIKACPKCGSAFVDVYKYDSGWRYVECDARGCTYSGPGEGSIKQAIISHNKIPRSSADAPSQKSCAAISRGSEG